jgi:hypothetical protein
MALAGNSSDVKSWEIHGVKKGVLMGYEFNMHGEKLINGGLRAYMFVCCLL